MSTLPIPDDDAGYLADSLFDFPKSLSGWQYLTLSEDNVFASPRARAASADSVTPAAYLESDDPNCLIGRDFVHAGYQLRPCLHWAAPRRARLMVEGELALVRSTAAGSVGIVVEADDSRVLIQTLEAGQFLSFAVPVDVREGGFVRVLFSCHAQIDNNLCLFGARISRRIDAAAAAMVENAAGTFEVDWSPAQHWLEAAWPAGRAGSTDARSMSGPARDPFATDRPVAPVDLVDLEAAHRRLFPRFHDRYRSENFFSAPAD